MRKLLYPAFLVFFLWAGSAPAAAAGPGKPASRISPLADSLRKTGKAPGPAALEAFRGFLKKTGSNSWRVRYSPKTALPEAIVGAKTPGYSGTPAEAALAFLNDNHELLKVDPTQLRPAYSKTFMGITHLQYEQVYNSIPVEFAYVRVHVNSSGEVTGYQAKFEPEINVPLMPAYPAAYAENTVVSDLDFSARVTERHLVLFPDQNSDGSLKLAWKVRARAADTLSGIWVYYVGAADGKILFRYNDLRYYYSCPSIGPKATGTVTATVYDISPVPTDPNVLGPGSWTPPAAKPINGQYVWVGSYGASTRTVDGTYCSNNNGKVFASMKGPYFSVMNFRGKSAHFDNAGGVWHTSTTTVASPNPYANSQTYTYSVTVPDDWTAGGHTFAKVMPQFVNMSVGSMDNDGTITDGDELHVINSSGTRVASYIGTRSASFLGASVENPTYGLTLQTDASGVSSGFRINNSVYMVLLSSMAPATSANTSGSIIWSTSNAGAYMDSSLGPENALSEANAFYHLNKVKNYFDNDNAYSGFLNIDPIHPSHPHPADLSGHVPVMVHANGAADGMIPPMNGMQNAFYDLDNNNIMVGDGPYLTNVYRSIALDGTIVRHEYVHSVINKIYPIINFGEFGAISEAMADYFTLASFWREYDTEGGSAIKRDLTIMGNFLNAPRNLGVSTAYCAHSAGVCKMPEDWQGEVHDDSVILSKALYDLRKGANDLGDFLPGHIAYGGAVGLAKADVFSYAALFYFPDNFANFYDAFIDACKVLDDGSCPLSMRTKIRDAFALHGIPSYMAGADVYDEPVPETFCYNNNGPECATDISALAGLSATIYPQGDLDYYTLPISEGNFVATLSLPAAGASGYYPYAMFLIDAANRNDVAIAEPVISNTDYGSCPVDDDCFTNSSSISLSYNASRSGRYYLMVTGALNSSGGNSRVNSPLPYSLNLSYKPKGSATAQIATASFDRDTISFSMPYARFPMVSAPSSSAFTGAESVFQYAQLRDHNFQPIALARTDLAGGYLSVPTGLYAPVFTTDAAGSPMIHGTVNLNPGFASRYPGVGTVYLEVFGRNHMGDVFSLGVSNAFNLTTNTSDIVTYNNILGASNSQAIIKYDVLSQGDLSIKIYTITGSLVKTVYDGPVPAGKGTMEWDGTNEKGSKVASGIYYIKAKGPDLDKVDKIAVVR
ncbi:MAG: hypothetical protein A2218_12535 [Elusimicrobia bacterium RIFOXYA2_FULL_53_38]|nr:MAG: hypothetical protein A2218_12535 [Elusimicrobia bacterium RIFOXYA2_FULL_53_38]